MEKKNKNRTAFNWLRMIVHIGGILPLILLLWAALGGNLGFNPVQTVQQRTGNLGMIFLILSLSCTPIRKIFNLLIIGRLRKPLGLYAAFYAFLHFVAFAVWDYQLDFSLIWSEIASKTFIIFGAIALVILLVLAATSFKSLQRKMGKTWVWLHRLVYVAGVLVVIHYLLSIKGDLFNFQGDYALAIIALVIVSLLLMVRIPAFSQFLGHWSEKKE